MIRQQNIVGTEENFVKNSQVVVVHIKSKPCFRLLNSENMPLKSTICLKKYQMAYLLGPLSLRQFQILSVFILQMILLEYSDTVPEYFDTSQI